MGSAWREVRAGGLAVGVVLAMSLSGGVAAADPDPGAPPPAPSAASPDTSPAGSTADSTLPPFVGLRADLDVGNGRQPGDATGLTQQDMDALTAELDQVDQNNVQMSAQDRRLRDALAANSSTSRALETRRAVDSTASDDAKALQAELQASKDAAQKQADLAQQLLDELTTIQNQIFR